MKIGDYVRTKNGLIAKIININDFREPSLKYGIEANYIVDIGFIGDEDIKISSPNIIDLIEVGDYVNGYLIDYIDIERRFLRSERPYREDSTLYKDLIEKGRNYNQVLHFFEKDIKSIVTHEQFKKREFKVGD